MRLFIIVFVILLCVSSLVPTAETVMCLLLQTLLGGNMSYRYIHNSFLITESCNSEMELAPNILVSDYNRSVSNILN